MNGLPISLNGTKIKLTEIVNKLNQIGSKHGVGLIDYVESYIFGHKGREVYIAPAAEILLKAHADLENYLFEKLTLKQKKQWEQEWSYLVYHGLWFHPLQKLLTSVMKQSNQGLNGEVVVKLHKGHANVIGRTSDKGTKLMYSEKIVNEGFHEHSSAGFIDLFGMEMRLKVLQILIL